MGTISARHGRALVERGVVVDAELTRLENREADSDTGCQVRYRFRVGDRDYRREGIFGTEVGSDVPCEVQAAAAATGRVAVRYLPDDPSVNEPAAHARPQVERGWIAVGIGAFMLLAGAVRLALSLRPRARRG
jgi:hypothetical protein